jgi:hypothetical protein
MSGLNRNRRETRRLHREGRNAPSGVQPPFLANADKWKAPCSPLDNDAITALSKLKIPIYNRGSVSTHPVSEAVRAAMIVKAYRLLYVKGARSVLCIYGSKREENIAFHLNTGVELADQLFVDFYSPRITPKDSSRFNEPRYPTRQEYDAILAIDIYDTPTGPLGPLDFIQVMARYKAPVAVWVGFSFLGNFGVNFNESAWLRSSDGRISMHVKGEPAGYRDHGSMDWLWTNSKYDNGVLDLGWSLKNSIDNYRLVELHYHCKYRFASQPLIPGIEWKTLTLSVSEPPTWLFANRCMAAMYGALPTRLRMVLHPVTKVTISTQLETYINDTLAFKERSKLSLLQVKERVLNEINSDPRVKLLRDLVPMEFSSLCRRATEALYLNDVTRLSYHYENIRAEVGADLFRYNNNLNNLDQPKDEQASKLGLWMSLGLGSVVVYNKLKSYKMKTGSIFSACYEYISSVVTQSAVKFVDVITPDFLKPFNFPEEIITLCVVTPLIEESIKRKHWAVTYGIVALEAALAFATGGTRGLLEYCPAAMMHVALHGLPYRTAVVCHALFNYWALVTQHKRAMLLSPLIPYMMSSNRFASFRNTHYVDEIHAPVDERANKLTYFEPELSIIPTSKVPCKESYKTPCSKLKKIGNFIIPCYKPPTVFYLFGATSVPGRVPNKNDEMLDFVLNNRILVAAPMSDLQQANAWRDVPLCIQANTAPMDWLNMLPSWLDSIDDLKKRKKYKRQVELLKRFGLDLIDRATEETEIMVKGDEMLCKMTSDLRVLLNPRSIAIVHPAIQVRVGPFIKEAATRLKEQWSLTNPCWYEINGWTVYISYAGAATDYDLSCWYKMVMEKIKTKTIFIIVSGDDSLIIRMNTDGSIDFVEGDASMFDQSQGTGPLMFELKMLYLLGVDQETISILSESFGSTYVAKSRDRARSVKIKRKGVRYMRDTGGPTTSFGNSVVMGSACTFASTADNIENAFLSLGFDMKLRYRQGIEQCTFLKGMWYRCCGPEFTHYWGPLPSRVLKIGKTLTNPCELYKTKDLVAAYKLFANDLSVAYSYYVKVPCLRKFILNFKIGPLIHNLIEDHKIKAANIAKPPLIERDVIAQVAAHYGVEEGLVYNFEEGFPRQVCYFHEHPLYVKMALVDYS